MALPPAVLASLSNIDSDWALIPIDGQKRPVDPVSGELLRNWSAAGLNLEEFQAVTASPYVLAVGLVLGPASGVMAVDFDGPGSAGRFRRIYGRPPTDLPATVGWTSGLPQRGQLAYRVPLEFWPCLRGRRYWSRSAQRTTKCDSAGRTSRCETVFELRWDGHQSVIAGVHPSSGGYRWMEGRSPAEQQVADAPEWLLEPLFKQPQEPVSADYELSAQDSERALQLLAHIKPRDDYASWLQVGMALHSVDPGLLAAWVEWSRGSSHFDEAECLLKWRSFKGRGVTIGTLHHHAALDGYDARAASCLVAERTSRCDEAGLRQSPAASATPRVLSRHECRQRLEQAIADDLAQVDLELLIDELAASSELVPQSLRALLKALQQQAQLAEVLQEAGGALLQDRERRRQQPITLEQLFPPQLALSLASLTTQLPYSDTAVAMAWLACISGLTKLGTAVCGNPITRYVVPTNLYVCTVARSGQKKTPLERLLVVDPTTELRRDQARDNSRAQEDWRE